MNKIPVVLIKSLLEAFGSLWLIAEIAAFFSDTAALKIRSFWWLFLLFGFGLATFRAWPKRRFSYKMSNRDVCLELVIGDIFKQKDGSLIVGSNTSFATSQAEISKKSIQGLYTKKYFSSGTQALDAQIAQGIAKIPADIGATAAIQHDGHRAYLCAIATIGNNGVARSSVEELRTALASLWQFIGANGEKDTLNTPILGSGFSRINLSRENLIKEIVLSFVAATSEMIFCDGLRVVVHPRDVEKYKMDIDGLVEFMEYTCKYAISPPSNQGAGRPDL